VIECDTAPSSWMFGSLGHLCGMTLSYVRRDSFIPGLWGCYSVTRPLRHGCFGDNNDVLCRRGLCAGALWYTASSLSCVCDMNRSYVWHDSFICVTWLIHICDMTRSYVWHDSFMCALWYTASSLSCVCDMTRSCVWHDAFVCVTWLVHTCAMTRSYVCHDSFICVTWLIHLCDMTRSYV